MRRKSKRKLLTLDVIRAASKGDYMDGGVFYGKDGTSQIRESKKKSCGV